MVLNRRHCVWAQIKYFAVEWWKKPKPSTHSQPHEIYETEQFNESKTTKKKVWKILKLKLDFVLLAITHTHTVYTSTHPHTGIERFNANGTHSTVLLEKPPFNVRSLFWFLFFRWKFDAFRFRFIPPGHHIHNANFICKVMRSTSYVWVDDFFFFLCSLSIPVHLTGWNKIHINWRNAISFFANQIRFLFFVWFIQSGRHSEKNEGAEPKFTHWAYIWPFDMCKLIEFENK